MAFTASHIYFHSFLVKDDVREILFTNEREEDLSLLGLFENRSLCNKHFASVQVREAVLCSNIIFGTTKCGMVGIKVE